MNEINQLKDQLNRLQGDVDFLKEIYQSLGYSLKLSLFRKSIREVVFINVNFDFSRSINLLDSK